MGSQVNQTSPKHSSFIFLMVLSFPALVLQVLLFLITHIIIVCACPTGPIICQTQQIFVCTCTAGPIFIHLSFTIPGWVFLAGTCTTGLISFRHKPYCVSVYHWSHFFLHTLYLCACLYCRSYFYGTSLTLVLLCYFKQCKKIKDSMYPKESKLWQNTSTQWQIPLSQPNGLLHKNHSCNTSSPKIILVATSHAMILILGLVRLVVWWSNFTIFTMHFCQ